MKLPLYSPFFPSEQQLGKQSLDLFRLYSRRGHELFSLIARIEKIKRLIPE